MSSISTPSAEQLQQENARLLALLSQQESTIDEQKTRIKQQEGTIETLRHQLHLFCNTRFGRKTEKGVMPEQMALQFDETYTTAKDETALQDDGQTETITYTRSKKKTGRKALPKSLPYVEKIYDLRDDEKQCPCGCALTHIVDDISEQLDVVPQMTFRVVHIRKKYACKTCEETIKSAKLPKQPIDRSIAAPGLLGAVINAKFNRHMPLYRQEAMFAEAGTPVTRATLSHWLIKSAHLLTPLVKLMVAIIHEHDIAYADETPLQVLKEKDRLPTTKSYMWLFIGVPPDKRTFVYTYHPTRAHQVPLNFFADFKGYLHAYCYSALSHWVN